MGDTETKCKEGDKECKDQEELLAEIRKTHAEDEKIKVLKYQEEEAPNVQNEDARPVNVNLVVIVVAQTVGENKYIKSVV